MCELHLVILYIYDQNTTIQMFVVVFCSFVVLCVVYCAMLCVNACICTVSSMHAFSAVYDQAFPCPFYTQSRHTEYELGVLMMGNIPNPNEVQTYDTCLTG